MGYYSQMINLDGVQSFAEGGNRKCYINPTNPKRCLKILHKNLLENLQKNSAWYKRLGNSDGLDDNLREKNAYNQKAIRSPINPSIWDHLAKWHGMVETNLGPQIFQHGSGAALNRDDATGGGGTVDWANANIHILNHGLHYASCVFEGERV